MKKIVSFLAKFFAWSILVTLVQAIVVASLINNDIGGNMFLYSCLPSFGFAILFGTIDYKMK